MKPEDDGGISRATLFFHRVKLSPYQYLRVPVSPRLRSPRLLHPSSLLSLRDFQVRLRVS